MSSARSMTETKRAQAYQRQTGRSAPTPKQRRRLDHKSRRRFGFVSWAWYAAPAVRGFRPDRLIINELVGSPKPPSAKDFVILSGTGL